MNALAETALAGTARPLQTLRRRRAHRWLPASELLHGYAYVRGRALAAEDPAAAQQRQLLRLIRHATATRFGRDHDFTGIRSVADFQARVPLRSFDDLWNDYWRAEFPRLNDCTWPGLMPYFAVSSGTSSGQVKYIPCSREMVRSNKRAALDVLIHHVLNRPKSRVFDGKCFLLGGSTDLKEQAPGVRSGDISGIAAEERPKWVQPFYFPPRGELTFLTDWEEKIERLAKAALEEDIRFVSGAPGWLAILFEKLASLRPCGSNRIVDIFPDLEVLTHGGVSFAPYRKRFETLLEGSRAELREVYPASEGFVAIADRGPGEGLRLLADNGLFFEFVPVAELGQPNPTRHWLGTVETGVDYALVLNTCAGLWGYLIGDVVRFVERRPARVLITGRTSYMLSTFGEHLSGALLETAVLAAAAECGVQANEFAVGVQLASDTRTLGGHVYVIELADGGGEEIGARLAVSIDRELRRRNEDYDERRAIALGVRAPVVRVVGPGMFAAWLKSRGRLGGQNKVPRVVGDPEMLADLLAFISR